MPGIKINSQALRDYLAQRDMKFTELSAAMGRTPAFISAVLGKGSVSAAGYKALCNTLGVSYGTFREENITPSPAPSDAYRLNLIYSDSKVLVQLMRGDQVVSGAWALVKEQTNVGFIQAISYAAHMMYKFAEQDGLNREELA